MLSGECQFHATGTATHNSYAEVAVAVQYPRLQCLPVAQPLVDGLDRQGMFLCARHIDGARSRTGVDREQVIVHGRAAWHLDQPFSGVDAIDLAVVEPCAGETGQWPEVDMDVIEVVVTGDVSRQHAGVGRMDVAGDQGQTHTGHGLHAEHAQHRDMRMPAADQNDVFQYWGISLHRLPRFGAGGD